MKLRIQKSMILVVAATLLISSLLFTMVLYKHTIRIFEDETKQEADYIKTAINILGNSYLEEMDNVQKNTRVTLIAETGMVLYDSNEEKTGSENHKNREEFKEALKNGTGEATRVSNTVGKRMYYYAVVLEDGNVLRVAKTMDNLTRTVRSILPAIGTIAVIMFAFAALLSRWQTIRLIKPINELDLKNPLENDVYEELTPFLESMDRQNKEKEKMEQMRREFSANVSHELKTPLTSISGYAEIIKNGMVRQEDIPVFSERIYHEASRLITLVEDIIKLSKLDEGVIELEKETVDLFELTREVCGRLSLLAEKKRVAVSFSGEPVTYRGIRQILDEMIYNLCENAIKYNMEGGKVTVWTGNTLQGIKVIVSDTGIGIPEEDKERIFERFYRVDKSHSKERGGTGLGLSIVKHGAMLHHAEVRVESELGKGTKVELVFPK